MAIQKCTNPCVQRVRVLTEYCGMQASWLLVQYVPLPGVIRPEAFGIFIINIVLGAVCIFFK